MTHLFVYDEKKINLQATCDRALALQKGNERFGPQDVVIHLHKHATPLKHDKGLLELAQTEDHVVYLGGQDGPVRRS